MKIIAGVTIENDYWIIGKTLEVLSQFCDKIIVTDNSNDNTMEICNLFPKVLNINQTQDNLKFDKIKRREETWNNIISHEPDYILFLNGNEIPTPSFISFMKNIDNNINGYRSRVLNLGSDNNFKMEDSLRKLVLIKYDKNFKYDVLNEQNNFIENTGAIINDIDDFSILSYNKNDNLSDVEINNDLLWDIEDKGEIIIKGADIFKNHNGTISNYYLDESINLLGLIHTKCDALRSNHYHPIQTQKVLIIKGKYLSISKDLNKHNSKIKVVIVSDGDLIITPPYVAHTNIFLEDTISINLVNGNRNSSTFNEHTIKYELVSEDEKKMYLREYKNQ